jgi:uncharacterized coiled-coil protein SlyX
MKQQMEQRLQQRLQQLKSEFESGQKVLADLDAKQIEVRNTLLRIQGAIQVLEEELANYNGASSEPEAIELLEKES